MNRTLFMVVTAIIFGSNISLGRADTTAIATLKSNMWSGDVSTDFFFGDNYMLTGFDQPYRSFPFFIGPVEAESYGIHIDYRTPKNQPVLSSDYTSTNRLILGSGVGASLTINNNATYRFSSAHIGTSESFVGYTAELIGDNIGYFVLKYVHNGSFLKDFPNLNDTPEINLNNGHLVGDVFVGVNGQGALNIDGASSVTGNLTLAQTVGSVGTLNIAPDAQWTLNGNLLFGAGTARVNNKGSSTTLNGYISTNGNVSFVNHNNAILNVSAGTSAIGSDFINNGLIDIADNARLNLNGKFSGNGTANLHTTGNLNLGGVLAADSALAVTGGNIGFNNLNSPYTLALSGNYGIDSQEETYSSFVGATGKYSSFAGTVTNTGQATLKQAMYGIGEASVWRNLSGSSLTLSGSSANLQRRSRSSTLINDSGATLNKIGKGSPGYRGNIDIEWNTVNNGLLAVAENAGLTITGTYSGDGTIDVGNAASLLLYGGFSGNSTANLHTTGSLFLSKIKADSTLAVTGGNIGFNIVENPYTLALSGNYGIGSGGIAGTITNSGQATLKGDLWAIGKASVWRNLSGGSLTLCDGCSLNLADSDQGRGTGTLINDSGATLSVVGNSSNYHETRLNWKMVNNGVLALAEHARILISEPYSGNGIIDVGDAASLHLLDYSGNSTANLHTNGYLILNSVLTDSALAVTGGHIGFSPFHYLDQHTLALSGRYGIGYSEFAGALVTNSGQATLEGTMFGYGRGQWRNLSGGSLTLSGNTGLFGTGTLINNSGATLSKVGNSSSIDWERAENGSSSSIDWEIVNNGNISIQNGSLSVTGNVTGNGTVNVNADATLQISSSEFQARIINLDASGTFDFNGGRLQVQEFNGDFTQTQGVFAPAASQTPATINGNYTMTGSSVFEVALAGTMPGEFSQLHVTGNVNLSQAFLSIQQQHGFTLTNDQFFELMIVDGLLSGSFMNLAEGALVGNYGKDMFITYRAGDGNDIALYTRPVPLPAAFWFMAAGLAGLIRLNRSNF